MSVLLAGLLVPVLFGLLIAGLVLASLWRVFEKAGQPGWAALIPIYNAIVMLQITGKPVWWVIFLIFCPPVSLILSILVAVELSNRFGMGAGFAVGLILLPYVFYPILGFGSAEYRGGRGLRSGKRTKRRPIREEEEDEDDFDEEPPPRAIKRARTDDDEEEEDFDEEPAPRAKKRPRTEDVDEDEEDIDEEPPPRARPKQPRTEDIEDVQRPRESITPAKPKPPPAAPGTVRCPSCGVGLRPPAGAAGKRLKCPKCQTVFVVPVARRPADDEG
ncbi:MAG TPA: DUF5684 domain-containing protein [Gemmataceae bacterium]|jgi:hypothetical protein|nr:DUF5684 domain-containing protein [Gemmataceae bacterium]